MNDHNKETDDPIILSRGRMITYLLAAAVAGGAAGCVVCHMLNDEDTEDAAARASLEQSHDVPAGPVATLS